jgi:hypothetical protein
MRNQVLKFRVKLLGKKLHKITEENNSVLCLDFNFDGSLFATAGKDFNVLILQ